MKKKFNFLINTIIFANLFFLFFVESINAKPRCEELYDYTYNDPYRKDVNLNTAENKKTIGIRLDKIAGEDKESYLLKKTNENYFVVGKVTRSDLANLIFIGDEILSINGFDLREIAKDEKKLNKISTDISDLFNENETIIFKIRRENKSTKEKEILTIDKNIFNEPILNELRNYDEIVADFYITSIDVDEKEGFFTASIQLDYYDLLDDRYYLSRKAWETIVYDKKYINDKLDMFWYERCSFSDDEWNKLNSVDVKYGLEFDNLINQERINKKSEYFIEPLIEWVENNSDNDQGYFIENMLNFYYKSKSVYKFKNQFNLKSFPFDKQKIKIFLRQDIKDLDDHRLFVSTDLLYKAYQFKEENSIQGWNIEKVNLGYKIYDHPTKKQFMDGFQLEYEIERKSSYYVYKIILPIILILVVCWSALWIPKRELESRLTITIVCLLSLIAYNFVIDSDLPKLEYLTIMDYFILNSYIFATIPTFLAIFSVNKFVSKHLAYLNAVNLSKKYGLIFYFIITIFIFILNITLNSDNASSIIHWASMN